MSKARSEKIAGTVKKKSGTVKKAVKADLKRKRTKNESKGQSKKIGGTQK